MTMDLYPTRTTSEPSFIPRSEPVAYGKPGDGPLGAEELADFDINGFHHTHRLLDPGEVAMCRAQLERLLQDGRLRGDKRTVLEPASRAIRSVFEVHKISDVFAALLTNPRILAPARQILGSDVYIHQSRLNFKPAFGGSEFYWHSDFETCHAEDGMPRMRALSISIALTENLDCNGPLMIMPGSHRTFVSCPGQTPEGHAKESLRNREVGTPDPDSLAKLADKHGIEQFSGPAGSATLFDSNCMHGSNSNITPLNRPNVFVMFNSVENALQDPYAAPAPRPAFMASRDFTPVG